MGMRITTNVASLNAQRTMTASQREIQKSFAQLSSGSRITKAADDAAGLGISENLKSQIRSLGQASRNANDGISMVQVAEGGLTEGSNILVRMRELAVQGSSDTVGNDERKFINGEVQQLKLEMERIAKTTRFGKTDLLGGESPDFDIQVGINNNSFEDRITFKASDLDSRLSTLGIAGMNVENKEDAQNSLAVIDKAQGMVAGYRANLGALQNRFQSTVDNLGVQHENLSAANSRIRDTDIAASASESARNNILLQSTASVLAQANQIPNLAMKMLG